MNDNTERRALNKELLAKIKELSDTVHSIKGNQAVIKQYIEVQFGGRDLIGTSMEGNVTRALREINEKIKAQNGRVTTAEAKLIVLENYKWKLTWFALLAGAIVSFLFKIIK